MKKESIAIVVGFFIFFVWMCFVTFWEHRIPDKIKFFFFSNQQKLEWNIAVKKLENINQENMKEEEK